MLDGLCHGSNATASVSVTLCIRYYYLRYALLYQYHFTFSLLLRRFRTILHATNKLMKVYDRFYRKQSHVVTELEDTLFIIWISL